MRGNIVIGILLMAAVAAAQGKPTIAEQLRGGTANQQLRSDLGQSGTAGPGYVQQDFFKALRDALKEKFGEKRGAELYQNLLSANVTTQDVLDLMNGKRLTESKLMKLFGATRDELDRLRQAIEKALAAKNRKIFFGILIVEVAGTEGADATVLQATTKAVEGMPQESFEKLVRGAVSTATIGEAFGITDKGARKQMQDALNALRNSPLVNHPMAESLGLAKGALKPELATELAEGMPGSGEEFKDGEIDGLPFDPDLPPLPFAGENMGFAPREAPAPASTADSPGSSEG